MKLRRRGEAESGKILGIFAKKSFKLQVKSVAFIKLDMTTIVSLFLDQTSDISCLSNWLDEDDKNRQEKLRLYKSCFKINNDRRRRFSLKCKFKLFINCMSAVKVLIQKSS